MAFAMATKCQSNVKRAVKIAEQINELAAQMHTNILHFSMGKHTNHSRLK